MDDSFALLDIVDHWGRLNDSIIALVDVVPDDKLDWSPRGDLWTAGAILKHVADARDVWLGDRVRDGETRPELESSSGLKESLQEQLRVSWQRLSRFLSDQAKLDTDYKSERRGEPFRFSGHWLAFHLLEHDVHHRSDIFHYLALLGIDHPEIGTP